MTDNCESKKHISNARQEILDNVMCHEVLAMVGDQREVPLPDSRQIDVRKYTQQCWSEELNLYEWNYNAINVDVYPYERSFKYKELYCPNEDWKIPEEQIAKCTRWIWCSRECRRAIELLRCKRMCYAGGNSRDTVNERLNVRLLRKVSKVLKSNNAKKVHTILAKEPRFKLKQQEQAFYFAFVHVHLEHDLRALPKFIGAECYESLPYEMGTWENFRFFRVDVFRPYESEGAKVDGTGLYSFSGSRVDVYPLIIAGQNAWASLAFRGENSFKLKHIPSWISDKTDPLGTEGVLAAQYWDTVEIQNENWMAIVEVGSSDV